MCGQSKKEGWGRGLRGRKAATATPKLFQGTTQIVRAKPSKSRNEWSDKVDRRTRIKVTRALNIQRREEPEFEVEHARHVQLVVQGVPVLLEPGLGGRMRPVGRGGRTHAGQGRREAR